MRSFHLPLAMVLTVAATIVILVAGLGAQLVIAQSDMTEPAAPATRLPNLEARLNATREQSDARTPAAVKKIAEEQLEALRQAKIVETALNVGDTISPFALPDAHGDTVFSERLLKRGPLVVVFYRGGWCPYCNLTLQAMQMSLPVIHDAGALVVAISPEPPSLEMKTIEANQLRFPLLSDSGLQVARQFGVAYEITPALDSLVKQFGLDFAERNRTDKPVLPLGVTYVIDQAGVIRYAYLSIDYTTRAEPADIVAAIEAID